MAVTAELGLPVIGIIVDGDVTVGGGSSVGGVGTPLNVGVSGENVVGAVDVIVTPLDVVVTEPAIVAGAVVDMAGILSTMLPLNCVGTGNEVNVAPLKASATTPIGTSELMNNNPVNG